MPEHRRLIQPANSIDALLQAAFPVGQNALQHIIDLQDSFRLSHRCPTVEQKCAMDECRVVTSCLTFQALETNWLPLEFSLCLQ